MATLDPLVDDLAPRQHGLVTRRQLLDRGASSSAIGRAVRAGRLVPIRSGVYRSGGTPMTWHANVLGSCLATGAGVASHRTAAVLWDVEGARPGRPDVSVGHPYGRAPSGVRLHQVTDLDLAGATVRSGIPVVGAPRLLVDLATIVDDVGLLRVLDDLERRHLVDLELAIATWHAHRRVGKPGIARLGRVLTGRIDEQDVPDSALEREFRVVARAAGLEEPDYHVVVADEQGRIVEVDGLWRPQWVVLEMDGRSVHARRESFDRDAARRLRLQAAGYAVAVVTWTAVRTDPASVVGHLRRLLAMGGPGARTAVDLTRRRAS